MKLKTEQSPSSVSIDGDINTSENASHLLALLFFKQKKPKKTQTLNSDAKSVIIHL